jgi:hypothetical protein
LGRWFYIGPFDVGIFWKGKELLKAKIAEGKRIVKGKMLKRGWLKVFTENFNIGFRKQSWERTSYIGLKKAKTKEQPKRTWDSAHYNSKDQDFKRYAYRGCRQLFASLSTKALAFLCTNNQQTEKEYMETIPFKIASKNQIPRSKHNKGCKWPVNGELQTPEKRDEGRLQTMERSVLMDW